MTRILDLSNREQDLPVDVVDLGTPPMAGSESSTHPSKLTPPNDTYTDNPYTYTQTNGNGAGYNTAGSYSKLVNLRGLASSNPGSGQSSPEHRSQGGSTCC